jgi:hypothetical protein
VYGVATSPDVIIPSLATYVNLPTLSTADVVRKKPSALSADLFVFVRPVTEMIEPLVGGKVATALQVTLVAVVVVCELKVTVYCVADAFDATYTGPEIPDRPTIYDPIGIAVFVPSVIVVVVTPAAPVNDRLVVPDATLARVTVIVDGFPPLLEIDKIATSVPGVS